MNFRVLGLRQLDSGGNDRGSVGYAPKAPLGAPDAAQDRDLFGGWGRE
jgi:hypothetical protein